MTTDQQTPTLVSRHRTPAVEHVDPLFLRRWSPRAMTDKGVSRAQVMALLEAARWAPSSYNEQPWRFVYAIDPEDRQRLLDALFEGNRSWAQAAPVLIFVLASPAFARNGRPNPHAWFDAGAAWMSLALQATKLGLHTHAMGGFDSEKARKALDLGDDLDVICAVAVGHQAPATVLPEKMAQIEAPSPRRPFEEIAFEARYGGGA